MNENSRPLTENTYVKELFDVLRDNGKDTAGLDALINHVGEMEGFVKTAEKQIANMKSQLDSIKEVENHPLKNALKNVIKNLETKVGEIKVQLAELKSNVINGCKNTLEAFKNKGVSALDKMASFFRVKSGLRAVKSGIASGINGCDKAVADIKVFSEQYHTAGRALKNMARVVAGKEPIDAKKEAGKLAKAISAPYRAEKACLINMSAAVDKAVVRLEQIEKIAHAKRDERPTEEKSSLAGKLAQYKALIRQKDAEAPKHEHAPKTQQASL